MLSAGLVVGFGPPTCPADEQWDRAAVALDSIDSGIIPNRFGVKGYGLPLWRDTAHEQGRRRPHLLTNIYWNLPTGGTDEYRLTPNATSGCRVTMATFAHVPTATSGFLRGSCPKVLASSSSRLVDWTRAPSVMASPLRAASVPLQCHFYGYNPSIVVLPADSPLRAVPGAHYLVALNSLPFWTREPVGGVYDDIVHGGPVETCPVEPTTTVGLFSRQMDPLLLTPLLRELAGGGGAVPPLEALDPSSPRMAQSTLMDVGLFEYGGRYVASAQDYSTQMQGFEMPLSERALVVPLRVELFAPAGCAPRLLVTHAEAEEHSLGSCAHAGCDPADFPPLAPKGSNHKNPSFFVEGDELLALDWIAPTAVGRVTTLPPGAQDGANVSNFWSLLGAAPRLCPGTYGERYPRVDTLCFETAGEQLSAAAAALFADLAGEDKSNGTSMLHGGRMLVRVPALGNELLGVGHLARGSGTVHGPVGGFGSDYPFNGNHYTHFFFTLSASPPYALTRISTEFCFRAFSLLTGEALDDCDSVQYSSSIVLEPSADGSGHELLIGYGAIDSFAMVTTVPLQTALDMLEPLPQ
ncbi:hypothetical protein EMIHUDRAFT_452328 [Emiliania huxleyi CCMP1516]|uniref:Uncharacterized protein n=2 Tax=Emiliania huxleyi TaxID=2903 RepID=A0A0D3IKT1_EMIH1|nr:hypothetical protein EMIHUDRAFT_452328 [Emiliania huxleyi CCMP1516]EOD11866.1 hypothetical protein EMIHUDRAFT_452328 [Emiliania huxleyi CCMP1516]|eukprot:XP_005764295.1 hypothetical protein EMIHUDRAFT_452328 [Emiliania huxleyi CCMP1516]